MNVIIGPPSCGRHSQVPWPQDLQNVDVSIPIWLSRLLRHNGSLSLEEEARLSRMRSALLADMSRIDEEQRDVSCKISELQARLDCLKEDNLRMRKQSFICDVAASPFRRLPNDIVYNIIKQCGINPYDGPTGGARRTHMPSVLSHVCRQFRQTVMGTSSLWNDMRACFRFSRSADDNALISSLQAQIGHFSRLSRGLPIMLELTEYNIDCKGDDLYYGIYGLLGWLANEWPHRHRLSKLVVVSPRIVTLLHIFTNSLLGTPTTPFPTLTSCSFKAPPMAVEPDADVGDNLVLIASRLPLLRKLWIDSDVMEIESVFDGATLITSAAQSWYKLTSLCISFPLEQGQWHSVLKSCANLVLGGFVIDDVEGEDRTSEDVDSSDVFVHQSLQDLRLDLMGDTRHAMVFYGFRFPRLTTLQLRFDDVELVNLGRSRTSAAGNKADEIFPVLKRLILANMAQLWNRVKYIYPLIHSMPTLTSLEATSLSNEDAVSLLNFVRRNKNGKPFLPNLKHVILTFTPRSVWTQDKHKCANLERALTKALMAGHPSADISADTNEETEFDTDRDIFDTRIQFIWTASVTGKHGSGPQIQKYLSGLREQFARNNVDIMIEEKRVASLGSDDHDNDEVLRYFEPDI